MLVAVNVVHYLSALQWPAKHLFSYDTVLMATVALTVSRIFDGIKSRKLSQAVIGSALLFWCDVVGIAIAAHTLRVHSAHAVTIYWLVAAFDFAGAGHRPTVAGNRIILLPGASGQADIGDQLLLVGAEVHSGRLGW